MLYIAQGIQRAESKSTQLPRSVVDRVYRPIMDQNHMVLAFLFSFLGKTCLPFQSHPLPRAKSIILLFGQQTESPHSLSRSTNFHINRRKNKKIKIAHHCHYDKNQPKIPLCLIKNYPLMPNEVSTFALKVQKFPR